jgi:hypothetical protein
LGALRAVVLDYDVEHEGDLLAVEVNGEFLVELEGCRRGGGRETARPDARGKVETHCDTTHYVTVTNGRQGAETGL